MGMNICVYDGNGNESEEWDSCRMNADKTFSHLFENIDDKLFMGDLNYEDAYTILDTKQLRENIKNWDICNDWKDRYYLFCDLMDKGYYYHFSY